MRVMVTGASGFLGIPLCEYLRAQGHDVTGIWHNHRPPEPAKQARKADLTSRRVVAPLVNELAPDWIFHTAAFPNVDACEKQPDQAFAINAEAAGIIASLAPGRVIYTSTDLVFSGEQGFYDESSLASPPNVYAKSKALGESYVLRSGNTVVRLALLIGRSRSPKPSFLDWLETKLANNEDVPLFVDQYRSPVYVPVVCAALEKMMQPGVPAGIYHLGGEQRLNRWELAKLYFRHFPEKEYLARPVRAQEAGLMVRGADCSLKSAKLKSLLGMSTGTMEEAFADLAAGRVT